MFRCPMGTLAGLALVACSAMACTAIVPSTAARLASFDPLTANPAVIELVVILPPGLAVSPGSARLELSADRGTDHRSGSFQLADRAIPPGMDLPAGATARGFAIAGADVARMRALQAGIAAWKAKGEARGTLGLGIGGCAIGEGPAPEATGSVLIRLGAGGPYLPLVADGRLSDLLGPDVLAAIKPCQGAE